MDRQSPILSIITVSYNDPEGLSRTISSLEGIINSPFSWELLVVDASPELNRVALSPLEGDSRLRHIIEKPAGIYTAMNTGLNAAHGKYVWFLNGGDTLASASVLSKVLETAETKTADLVHAAAELVRDGQPLYIQRPRWNLFHLAGINRCCHQGLVYRRELFKKLGRFNAKYRLAADYEFNLKAYADNARVALLDQTLARYDMGGQSSNHRKALAEFAQIHQALQRENKLPYSSVHATLLLWERVRIHSIKTLAAGPGRKYLEPIWRAYQRLRR